VGFGLAHHRGDPGGGQGGGETFGSYVGDAEAFGVGAADLGIPGEVGSEGIRGAQAGTLSDQDQGELGVQELADFVRYGYSALPHQGEGGEVPVFEFRAESFEEGPGVVVDGLGGESVGDYYCCVIGAWLEQGASSLS
jgi:hypothetical protein